MAIISSMKENQIPDLIRPIYEKFKREGKKVPEWVGVMAHRPEILKEFFELFNVVMGEGKVEKLLKWKIAYSVSETLRCPFCVDVTSDMLKKMGASDEVISKIKEGKGLEPKERKVLELVREVTLKANVCQEELFDMMKEEFTEAEIVEIVSVIGLFNYINRFNNTFCILPE